MTVQPGSEIQNQHAMCETRMKEQSKIPLTDMESLKMKFHLSQNKQRCSHYNQERKYFITSNVVDYFLQYNIKKF